MRSGSFFIIFIFLRDWQRLFFPDYNCCFEKTVKQWSPYPWHKSFFVRLCFTISIWPSHVITVHQAQKVFVSLLIFCWNPPLLLTWVCRSSFFRIQLVVTAVIKEEFQPLLSPPLHQWLLTFSCKFCQAKNVCACSQSSDELFWKAWVKSIQSLD